MCRLVILDSPAVRPSFRDASCWRAVDNALLVVAARHYAVCAIQRALNSLGRNGSSLSCFNRVYPKTAPLPAASQ